ncbi:MAG: hypothetical protein OXG53_06075 [Chloroflexi bacterium]|nr:hypothetical protein [Chloroflexota bacterium]
MRAVDRLRARASAMRYERIQLFFDSVDRRIAEDKVAESINGYLLARDAGGAEVRRPARRGVAYRMLKEYGNGNVYLALRSTYKEVMLSLARDVLQVGEAERGLSLVARTLA